MTNTRIIIKIRPLQKEVTRSQSPAASLKGTFPTSLVCICPEFFSADKQTRVCIFQNYVVLLSHINGDRIKRYFATCVFSFNSKSWLLYPIWGTRDTAHVFSLLHSRFQHFPGHGHLFTFSISGFYKEHCGNYMWSRSSSKSIWKKLSGPRFPWL